MTLSSIERMQMMSERACTTGVVVHHKGKRMI